MKKILLILPFFIFMFAVFSNGKANALNLPKSKRIFITTLSHVPNEKIVKDFGFILWIPNATWHNFFTPQKALISNISKKVPTGANACINLKVNRETVTCESVLLKKK